MRDKLPDEFTEGFKTMERAVQIKMQELAEEKKKARRIEEEVERIKKQLVEDPPYVRAERERREQEAEQARLADMDPDERRQWEVKKVERQLREQVDALQKQTQLDQVMAFKKEMLFDIKVGLLEEQMPVKEAGEVYDVFLKHAVTDAEYTVADAIAEYKEVKAKNKPAEVVDVEALTKKIRQDLILELKAKKNKANGARPSGGERQQSPANSSKKTPTSIDDIWDFDIEL
jgi:hypothetical protein